MKRAIKSVPLLFLIIILMSGCSTIMNLALGPECRTEGCTSKAEEDSPYCGFHRR